MQETTKHLLTECNFVETLLNLIASSLGLRENEFMIHQGGMV
jgi:hypothetical protein